MSRRSSHPARTESSLFGLALSTFLVITPVTLVVPVLKGLVQDHYGVGDFATSMFMSVNMIGAVFGAPLAGLLSDRLGKRRPLIVAALLLDAVLLLALRSAPTYATLMAFRFVEGITHILALSLVLALAADVAKRRSTGHVMGVVGATLTLGVALGAPLGGILGRSDPRLPLLVGAALSLVAAVVVRLLLTDDPAVRRPASLYGALRALRQNRSLFVPYAFAFTDRFTVGFFTSAFPLFLQKVHGRDSRDVGLTLALFLLPFALLCYPMGRLSDRVSRPWLMGGGSLVYGGLVCFVGVVPPETLPWLMVGLGVTSSVMFVPTLMLTGELSGPEQKGVAMGGFNAAGSLGFLVGPAVAGFVAQTTSRDGDLSGGYATTFVVAGLSEVLCVAVTIVALVRLERSRR